MLPQCDSHGGRARAEHDGQPGLELAELFERYGDAYVQQRRVTPQQAKAMSAIVRCRTAALGGHIWECRSCGEETPVYNSCRNRHCPKCQWLSAQAWVDKRVRRILPTHYFHVVFTLPQELRPLAMANPRAVYGLLMRSTSRTLLELGHDPKRLGGLLGLTLVLHTWSRDLRLHPHVHAIATGGGLSLDGQRWVSARSQYLFPAKVLKRLLRGKLLAGLCRLRHRGELQFDGPAADFGHGVYWDDAIDRLYRKDWVVYAKRPFGGPEHVIRYLGRYTHRVALSNRRLLWLRDDRVGLRTRDGKSTQMPALELIRRFLLHVLPNRFVKIRHYGLLASVNVGTKLVTARQLLAPEQGDAQDDDDTDTIGVRAAPSPTDQDDERRCPSCGGTDLVCWTLSARRRPPLEHRPRGPPVPTRGAS